MPVMIDIKQRGVLKGTKEGRGRGEARACYMQITLACEIFVRACIAIINTVTEL